MKEIIEFLGHADTTIFVAMVTELLIVAALLARLIYEIIKIK